MATEPSRPTDESGEPEKSAVVPGTSDATVGYLALVQRPASMRVAICQCDEGSVLAGQQHRHARRVATTIRPSGISDAAASSVHACG